MTTRPPSDQAERRGVLSDWDHPVAVDASAGTGKTHLLLDRLTALLLERGVRLSRVAAITFTEKAAGELLARLRLRLEEAHRLLPDRRADIERALEDLEGSPIGTIHAFCAGVLREHALAAGLDPRFTALDGPAAATLEEETWDRWIRDIPPGGAIPRVLSLGWTPGQLRDLSGALLRQRASLRRPQAAPFPGGDEATDLLQKGVTLLGAWRKRCKTEEDGLLKRLNASLPRWEEALASPEGDRALRAAALEDLKIGSRTGSQAAWGKDALTEARAAFGALTAEWETFRGRVHHAALTSLLETLWGWVECHQEEKRRRGLVDFDDMLLLTRDLLVRDGAARDSLRGRWDALWVDEFQDTDPLQAEIVFRLCEKKGTFAEDWRNAVLEGGKLMVVGDPKQSIYRFRRADVETYHGVLEAVRAASGRGPYVLRENFRSSAAVMAFVHETFGTLFKDRPEGWAPPSAYREDGESEGLPAVTVLRLEQVGDERAEEKRSREAAAVAAHLKDLLARMEATVWDRALQARRKVRAGDIAILFKDLSNNEQPFEEALRAAGVPYQVVGGKRFYRRSEVIALSNLLGALDSPADEALVVAALRGPAFGVSDADLAAHRDAGGTFRFLEPQAASVPPALLPALALLRGLREDAAARPVAETLRALLTRTPLLAVTLAEPFGEQRAANLWKVAESAAALERSETLTLRSFALWLRRRRDEETIEAEAPNPAAGEERVALLTVHQAKGLEFPVVVVPNAESRPRSAPFLLRRSRGTLEVRARDVATLGYEATREEEEAALEAENLRLLYVAVTRAREALVFPWREGTEAKGFLGPLTGGWTWNEEDEGTVRTLPCGARLQVVRGATERPGRDVSAYRLAYDPEGVEGPEAGEWARRFEEAEAARRAADDARVKRPTQRTAHAAVEEAAGEPREDAARWSSSGDGLGFGRLVHLLLESRGVGDATADRAAAWAFALGLKKDRVEEAFRAAASLASSPLGARIRASKRAFHEMPLASLRGGETREGRIDLAFLEGDEWVLVDFKTDRDPDRLIAQYEEQARFYASLLADTTGKKVKETLLVFLRGDGSRPVEKKVH